MKMYGKMEAWLHTFLTSVLVVGGQLHSPVALPPDKQPPCVHWIGGWMESRAGLDAVVKTKNRTPFVQLTA
jgi:hypothetical protein